MSKSYQKEIPNSRVNISLDVETSGAKEKVELPLHLLMLGNYSNNAKGDFSERRKISVNKHNINNVISDMKPSLRINVEDKVSGKEEININMTFEKLSDFKPDNIVMKVPQLKKLIAMRNLLKELRSHVNDNKAFRKELQSLVSSKEHIEKLSDEISHIIEDEKRDV